ncbi:MAG: hypothetical protein C0485_19475 [Pirellula sp.]|nr:hypothetical protein [Pirellula sp.]
MPKKRINTTEPVGGKDSNRDAITGEPGSHPVGAGLGAAAGGVAAGAAAGALGGPIGAAVGAVIGGVAGGLAGKGVAEQIDPTREDAYWRDEYANREYYDEQVTYDRYAPAYKYGWESRAKYANRNWADVEPQLQQEWDKNRGASDLKWERARLASQDAWTRVERGEGI